MSKIHYNEYGLSYTECGIMNSNWYKGGASFVSCTNVEKDVTCKNCLKRLMADDIVNSVLQKIERRVKRGKML